MQLRSRPALGQGEGMRQEGDPLGLEQLFPECGACTPVVHENMLEKIYTTGIENWRFQG